MNTVIDKPRTSAPRRSRGTPPTIARADVLANVREDIRLSSEKIQMALEVADHGSPAHQLLRLITSQFMPPAISKLARDPLTSNDVAAAYDGLFDALAALAGAIALSEGTMIHHTLVEAHETLDAAHSMLDSTAVVATSLPAAKTEDDFIRGRDLAMQLMAEGKDDEQRCEAFRAHRTEDKPQENFFKDYLQIVMSSPELIDGFSAVLTTVLGCQGEGIPASYFADLTLAETQAGAKGKDGTKTFDEPGDEVTEPANPVPPLASSLQLWREAMAAADLSAGDEGGDALRGAVALMELAEKEIEAAVTTSDGDDASLAMCYALAVLRLSQGGTNDNCELGIRAAISLATLAKDDLDSAIPELPQEVDHA